MLTAGFLMVILGVTDRRAPKGFGPLAIGLGLTLIHLISIPVTSTSVNPARSTSQAVFVGDWALSQLWVFWLAPLVGVELVAATGQDPDSAVTRAGEQSGAAGRRALEETEPRLPGAGADGR